MALQWDSRRLQVLVAALCCTVTGEKRCGSACVGLRVAKVNSERRLLAFCRANGSDGAGLCDDSERYTRVSIIFLSFLTGCESK